MVLLQQRRQLNQNSKVLVDVGKYLKALPQFAHMIITITTVSYLAFIFNCFLIIRFVHQPWHFPPSSQDPLFPAGLPIHLVPSSCASDSASSYHCMRLQIIITYLLLYKNPITGMHFVIVGDSCVCGEHWIYLITSTDCHWLSSVLTLYHSNVVVQAVRIMIIQYMLFCLLRLQCTFSLNCWWRVWVSVHAVYTVYCCTTCMCVDSLQMHLKMPPISSRHCSSLLSAI